MGGKKTVRACGTERSVLTSGTVNVPVTIRSGNNWNGETRFKYEMLDKDNFRIIQDDNGAFRMGNDARIDLMYILENHFPADHRTLLFVEDIHRVGSCYVYVSDNDNTLSREDWEIKTGFNKVEEPEVIVKESVTNDTLYMTNVVVVNLKNETVVVSLTANRYFIPYLSNKFSNAPTVVTTDMVRAMYRRKVIDTGINITSSTKIPTIRDSFKYVQDNYRIFIDNGVDAVYHPAQGIYYNFEKVSAYVEMDVEELKNTHGLIYAPVSNLMSKKYKIDLDLIKHIIRETPKLEEIEKVLSNTAETGVLIPLAVKLSNLLFDKYGIKMSKRVVEDYFSRVHHIDMYLGNN